MKLVVITIACIVALSPTSALQANPWDSEYCAFTYQSLFEVSPLGQRPVTNRLDPAGSEILVKIQQLTSRDTGIKYYRYATFRDEDDGGNTLGWIETSYADDRKILAKIGDSKYYDCTIKAPAADIQVKVKEWLSDDGLNLTNYEGSLNDFFRKSSGDNFESKLDFTISTGYGPESGAKEIAELAWLNMTKDERFQGLTCDYRLVGSVDISGSLSWDPNRYQSYSIIGEGDGEFDSCDQSSSPGSWQTTITITYNDYNDRAGSIYIFSAFE